MISAQIDASSHYFVAFIDILGFSNMVRNDLEAPTGSEKYIEKLYRVQMRTKEIRLHDAELNITQFSDSVVLAVKFNKVILKDFFDIVAKYQFDLFREGILCRGGIAYGRHFYKDDFMYSMGLIEAFTIESKIAKFPRIVVSDDLMNLVFPHHEERNNLPLIKEKDGLIFIDYFDRGDDTFISGALESIIENNKGVNSSVQEKIIWLKEYFNFKFPERKYELRRYKVIGED